MDIFGVMKTTSITTVNGSTFHFAGSILHREGGPAVTNADGTKFWYLEGRLHREDGPAIEWANGEKDFWFMGYRLKVRTLLGLKRSIGRIKKLLAISEVHDG